MTHCSLFHFHVFIFSFFIFSFFVFSISLSPLDFFLLPSQRKLSRHLLERFGVLGGVERAEERGRRREELMDAVEGNDGERLRELLELLEKLEMLERKRVREQDEEQLEVQNEEKGRVVDMVDEDGWTVVMASCYAGHSDCLKLLLQHGASRNSRCHEAG